MQCTQDGPLSWLVESESDPGVIHTVTLYKGDDGRARGYCDCEDFGFRHLPKLRRGGSLKANHCKHIRAVVEELKWRAVEVLVETFDEGETE